MASPFAITPLADKLKAENGNATTVFTVTNTTSRPLRGMAKIKPLGKTEMSWIKIDGETERDFPAGGTHEFTVAFSKPKPVSPSNGPFPAESFPFRVDVVSAANPDEDFTEGQVVTVEIPEQKGMEKKPFPWWIIAVAGVLLIVGAVVVWLVARDTDVEVPDVASKSLSFADAEKELKDKGFAVERADELAPDKTLEVVFKQDPAAGSMAEPNSIVKLTLPAATTVPPLSNKCLVQALDELNKRELRPGAIIGNRDEIATCVRRVGSADPKEGNAIAKGAEVSLNFPCVPQPGKLCLRFPIKDLVAHPAVSANRELFERLRTIPSP